MNWEPRDKKPPKERAEELIKRFKRHWNFGYKWQAEICQEELIKGLKAAHNIESEYEQQVLIEIKNYK